MAANILNFRPEVKIRHEHRHQNQQNNKNKQQNKATKNKYLTTCFMFYSVPYTQRKLSPNTNKQWKYNQENMGTKYMYIHKYRH